MYYKNVVQLYNAMFFIKMLLLAYKMPTANTQSRYIGLKIKH